MEKEDRELLKLARERSIRGKLMYVYQPKKGETGRRALQGTARHRNSNNLRQRNANRKILLGKIMHF